MWLNQGIVCRRQMRLKLNPRNQSASSLQSTKFGALAIWWYNAGFEFSPTSNYLPHFFVSLCPFQVVSVHCPLQLSASNITYLPGPYWITPCAPSIYSPLFFLAPLAALFPFHMGKYNQFILAIKIMSPGVIQSTLSSALFFWGISESLFSPHFFSYSLKIVLTQQPNLLSSLRPGVRSSKLSFILWTWLSGPE
jgi:hypothetical protein